MANTKYYVVWVGRKPGIYTSWPECQKQVNQFQGAKFKSFETKAEAEKAYTAGWTTSWGQASGARPSSDKPGRSQAAVPVEIDYDSISVDVGTKGNPGPVEYKGVDTKTGDILFSFGPIKKGTNNLGEFLAIVHALSYLKQSGSGKTVYTDSMNALKWVREKAVSSTLARDASTKEIWDLVDRAVEWLKTNTYDNKVLKWQTRSWGEIKADYGRK